MNPKLTFIFSRRSVRKYRTQAIDDRTLQDLMEAAMAAPSAAAKDPWHFIVVRKRENLDRLAARLPNGPMLSHAPAAIVVCGDIDLAHDRHESFMLQDLSAAVENVLLAANALGLGTCWLGIHPRKERISGIRDLFELPENIIPVAGIALGVPDETPGARTRFNADRIHSETW